MRILCTCRSAFKKKLQKTILGAIPSVWHGRHCLGDTGTTKLSITKGRSLPTQLHTNGERWLPYVTNRADSVWRRWAIIPQMPAGAE